MSELRVESMRMPAGNLGPASPLPPLRSLSHVHGTIAVDDSVPEHARKYLGYGLDTGVLPYTVQDGYDRDKQQRDFKVAVLENDILRATFTLEIGGRLWSLVHKPSGRELLYKNPVFQPANLAIRNAWFSGGVEWNCSVQGHTPFTCSPLFAARARARDGSPALRLYEWERIRGVPYQLDCWLPDGSPKLFVRVRIVNPHDEEIPMYWWSNIAVPEAPDVRVVVPAEAAYNFGYKGKMARIPLAVYDGIDRTYPTNHPTAADAFYDIEDGHYPWISALDKTGRGLVQSSTRRLRGRKLFVWGMGKGGRHWQEYLSVPGAPYIEIQAGLGRTQVECVPMPGNTEWSWLEAYGLMEADPGVVHGEDWTAAWQHVEGRLVETTPLADLDALYAESADAVNREPEEMIQRGAGWGALELKRRAAAGEAKVFAPGLAFDDASLGDAQAPWLALLESSEMPEMDPHAAPAWMVQSEWRALLEDAVANGRGDHWFSWLHLGVMRYHAGEGDAAEEAWERSLELRRSAWALRNLAVIARHKDDKGRAAQLLIEALREAPDEYHLAIECFAALLEADRPSDVLALLDEVGQEVHDNLRVRILVTKANLDLGRLDEVEAFLMQKVDVPDIREGEVTLTDLWFELHERRIAEAEGIEIDEALKRRVREEYPPPKHIDFRMS